MPEKDSQKEIADLKAQIRKLRKNNLGLVFEDKQEDIVEQSKTQVPVLKEVIKNRLNLDEEYPNNLMVEGDNYLALSVLNYTHKGKIDFIYIDPPYNTGAKDWKYNNDYVDSEDAYRHSKWLSFMSHRLKLSKDLLTNDGIICVTIDDNEMPRLWILLESIFGRENHLGTIAIRINPGGRKSKRKVALQHEYAIFFAKNGTTKVSPFYVDPEDKSHQFYQDENGKWYEERNLRKEGQDSLATKADGSLSDRYYPIYFDSKTKKISVTKKLEKTILPIDTKGQKRIWRRGKNDIERMFAAGDLKVKETKYGLQVYFRFSSELLGETPKSFWDDKKYSASEHGTSTLDEIMGFSGSFQFPKSPHAVRDCIRVGTAKKNAIILDFFAGSGTTAQAVLELNKDGGNRKFILCTNNENNNGGNGGIAESVCYPRIKNVIKGYSKNKAIPSNLFYYQTNLVDIEQIHKVPDDAKIRITYEMGEMIAVREDALNEVEKNEWWQIFEGKGKLVAIYFKEDKTKLRELIAKLENKNLPTALYIFSWGKNEYKGEYSSLNIRVEDIPEPIIEVYKEINRI